jgi:FKBP-type peptidyl-prolyl cis-trans isomerase
VSSANPSRPVSKRVTLTPELLEDRTVPSGGNVTAFVDGGVLRVFGDDQANHLRVTAIDNGKRGEAILIPLNGTTLNGRAEPIILGGIAFAYDIRMGKGDDFLWVTDTGGNISVFVHMGAGNDALTMDFARHTGQTVLRTGAGHDTVSLGMGKLTGGTLIDTGGGNDQVFVGGTEFGAVQFHSSGGVNSAGLFNVKWTSTPVMFGFQHVSPTYMPAANPDHAAVRPGRSVVINVAANDWAPGSTLDLASVQITAQPRQGTARVNGNGTVTYTANASGTGIDTFRYAIANAFGAISEAEVRVNLGGGQAPPGPTPPPTPSGRPAPTITTTATNPTNQSPIPFTVSFSRAVTGFTADDIQVTNGTVSEFGTTNARVYTFSVTPTADGQVVVHLPAGAAVDAAGRTSTAATRTITYDITAPVPTIRAGSAAGQTTIPFTITFDEDVTGFTADDVEVTGGTVSGFTAASARQYTFTVTPTGENLVRVNVPAGVATDAAGNVNRAALEFTTLATRTDAGMTATANPPSPTDPNWQTQASGLRIWDVQVGSGPAVTAGSTVGVFYTGWLLDGTVFDSAHTAGAPASFPLSGLIAGWQEGLPGMQPGGIRRLYIPSELAYGSQGTANIPPNSDLIFEIKLVSVV